MVQATSLFIKRNIHIVNSANNGQALPFSVMELILTPTDCSAEDANFVLNVPGSSPSSTSSSAPTVAVLRPSTDTAAPSSSAPSDPV